MNLLELAKAVKRGVKVLDKKIPNWRQVLRKHQNQFVFRDGDHCVLGTLEHFSGRMRVLKARKGIAFYPNFSGGREAIIGDKRARDFGFDGTTLNGEYQAEAETLDALWRAEFER